MTDEQLNAAALKLCEIRGWQPDGHAPLQPGEQLLIGASALWPNAMSMAKREILSFYQVAKALDTVLGDDLK